MCLFCQFKTGILCLPQQIYIPGLDLGASGLIQTTEKTSTEQPIVELPSESNAADVKLPKLTNTQARINMLPYNFNEDQLNDLFDMFSSNKISSQVEPIPASVPSNNNNAFVPNFDFNYNTEYAHQSGSNPNMFNNHHEAAEELTASSTPREVVSSTSTTPSTTTTPATTTAQKPTTTITQSSSTSTSTARKINYFHSVPDTTQKRPVYSTPGFMAHSSTLPPFVYNRNDIHIQKSLFKDESSKEALILNDANANLYNPNQPFAIPNTVNEYFYKANHRVSNPNQPHGHVVPAAPQYQHQQQQQQHQFQQQKQILHQNQPLMVNSNENQIDLSNTRPSFYSSENSFESINNKNRVDYMHLNSNKCNKNNVNVKEPDQVFCNMYHTCVSDGGYKTMLCTDGYLFSVDTLKCEKKALVNCGKRLALEFDRTNVQYAELMNNMYQMVPTPRVINGSLECSLGIDGYFADPEFWYVENFDL